MNLREVRNDRCVLLVAACLTLGYTSYMENYPIRISSKGQVVIPAALRKRHGLDTGTRATWTEEKGRLVLTPMSVRMLDEIQGSLKPRPGAPSAFEASLDDREQQRRRERAPR